VTSVIVFDSEWTGRKPGRQAIEIAYLTLRQGGDLFGPVDDAIPEPLAISASFCQRFKPSVPMTFGAMAVHHILPEELEQCEPAESFVLPSDVRIIVGHSVDGDWETIGKPDVKRICTYAMSQHLWPDVDGHSQSALLYMLNGATVNQRRLLKGAHGALVDVENNVALLEHILLAKPEIRTWSALWEFSEEARIPIYAPLKRWEGVKLVDMDDGAIRWCLSQDWLDEYFRVGLERVWSHRYPPREPKPEPAMASGDDDEIDDDDIPF
jgi:exodeoxyribonuclease X